MKMATQTGNADAFLKEILGTAHFIALQNGNLPLYDSNGRFDLGRKTAHGLTIEAKEGFRGAVFTLSKPGKDGFSYTLSFDRVNDPTTRGYTLCEISRMNPLPTVFLTEGRDFKATNLLTWNAIYLIKEAYDCLLNGKGPLIASRRKDFETTLTTSLLNKKTPDSLKPFSRAAHLAKTYPNNGMGGLTPAERDEQARRELFQGAGENPVHMEDGGYAAGCLYDTPHSCHP